MQVHTTEGPHTGAGHTSIPTTMIDTVLSHFLVLTMTVMFIANTQYTLVTFGLQPSILFRDLTLF